MHLLIFDPFPTLRTKRLVLRQLEEKDALLIFNYQSNKQNFLHVDMPVFTDISQAFTFIEEKNEGIQQNKWILWAVADINTDLILGTISIWNFNQEKEKAEFGYGLFPGNTGKGLMTEALLRAIDFGFKNLALKTLEAYTSKFNSKSISLLKRTNFNFDSEIQEGIAKLAIYKIDLVE
jgi:ribosomal-protein-alanine N-acetyltransferase